ncbi:thiopurine S-methyltransferase [Ancylobacter lacus]|uniref:thiopurine S-methyltransferase n=1 Tax=Ancylobacter lacus TaxID=2579970 RepID=UPI001BCF3B75|nr:thiopurine S-methyltransferase [Ancylobacter lacus]MBS7537470.1 thiopurine S-methyltransferase [Ancylobacter lacus]
MDDTFWHDKWQRGDIGFHGARPHPLLQRHLAALHVGPGARLLVPLCGKSLDIHWLLAQGHQVAGVELSRAAVEQLFAELGMEPAVHHMGRLACFEGDGLCVFVGNIFDLDAMTLMPVDAVYDRAALVALPGPLRRRYTRQIVELTGGAPQLLVTYEHDPAALEGPPFAVDATELARHYEAEYHLSCLERRAVEGGLRGHPSCEAAWHLAPR